MDKWIFAITSITLVKLVTSNIEVTNLCQKRTSLLGEEELICTNVTSAFFMKFDLVLNKTHWITCENCSLDIIDQDTFNVPRNNIIILNLLKSRIRILKALVFSKFLALKVLNLRHNFIDNISAKSFTNLNKLNQLDLSHNALKVLTNNLFADIENLDLLNLNYNNIFYVQPNAFAGLVNLKYLYLNNNELEKLEGFCFKHLTNLILLYLENNNIIQIDSFAFSNLNKLTALYLNNNTISYLVPYNFKPLNSLTDLQLRYNNLTEIQTSSFNGLKSLKFLYLGKNRLNKVKPYGFVGLNSLENLELMGNDFELLDLEYFKGVDNLNMLWLQRNRIAKFIIDLKSDSMSSLTTLGISENNFSSLNYKLLYNKMPAIKDIFIANNTWKCELLVNMFNFLQNKSVNLCISSDCNVNKTKGYIEDVCSYSYTEEGDSKDDFNHDFVTEHAGVKRLNLVLVVLSLIPLLNC